MNAFAWVVLAGGATWGVMSLLQRWQVRRFVQGFMQVRALWLVALRVR